MLLFDTFAMQKLKSPLLHRLGFGGNVRFAHRSRLFSALRIFLNGIRIGFRRQLRKNPRDTHIWANPSDGRNDIPPSAKLSRKIIILLSSPRTSEYLVSFILELYQIVLSFCFYLHFSVTIVRRRSSGQARPGEHGDSALRAFAVRKQATLDKINLLNKTRLGRSLRRRYLLAALTPQTVTLHFYACCNRGRASGDFPAPSCRPSTTAQYGLPPFPQ